VCLWFTGLSGAGKTTTARAVCDTLTALACPVTWLDGDELRAHLTPALGFSRADRQANVLAAAALAREAVGLNRVVLCSLISPFRDARERARALIGPRNFLEVFVDTPLEVCEARDPKGLYARARRGELDEFTGVTAVYEPPLAPDLTIDTIHHTVCDTVQRVLAILHDHAGGRPGLDCLRAADHSAAVVPAGIPDR
jgi:adenylyl-sulfate kinase